MDRIELLNVLLKRYNQYSLYAAKHIEWEHYDSKKSAILDIFDDLGYKPGIDIGCKEVKLKGGITYKELTNTHNGD